MDVPPAVPVQLPAAGQSLEDGPVGLVCRAGLQPDGHSGIKVGGAARAPHSP